MGGIESRANMLQRFNKVIPEKWELVRREGLTDIVTNSSGKEGEVNTIKLDPTKNIQEEQQIYYFRRTHDSPIVKCYAAEKLKQESGGVCGVDTKIKVITERVVKRWGELPQLSFQEIVYCLTQALRGYKLLYEEVGPFEVTRNMMGINKFGNLRVWLNQNFADNSPQFQKKMLFSTETFEENTKEFDSQGQMVKNIVQIIQEKCQQGKFPQSFREEIYRNVQSYEDCLGYMNSYSQGQKQSSPNKIHLENDKMYVSRLKKILVTQSEEQKKTERKDFEIQGINKNTPFQPEIRSAQQRKAILSLNPNSNVEKSVIIRNLKGILKEDQDKVKSRNLDGKPINHSPSQNSYVYNDFRYNPNLTVAESSLCQISLPSPIAVSKYTLQFDHENLEKKKLIQPLQIQSSGRQHFCGFTTSVYTNAAKPSNIKFNYISSPIQGSGIQKDQELRPSPVRLGEKGSRLSNIKIQKSEVLKEF